MPRQPLQHDRVEIEPLERLRRQCRGACVDLVRRSPLLPRMQRAGEGSDSRGVVGVRRCFLVCFGYRVASRCGIRIDSELRKRRDELRQRDHDGAAEHCGSRTPTPRRKTRAVGAPVADCGLAGRLE